MFEHLPMDRELNALDLGISRFAEHNFVLVWKVRPELEQFRAAAQTLLLQWPILGARLNFLVRLTHSGSTTHCAIC